LQKGVAAVLREGRLYPIGHKTMRPAPILPPPSGVGINWKRQYGFWASAIALPAIVSYLVNQNFDEYYWLTLAAGIFAMAGVAIILRWQWLQLPITSRTPIFFFGFASAFTLMSAFWLLDDFEEDYWVMVFVAGFLAAGVLTLVRRTRLWRFIETLGDQDKRETLAWDAVAGTNETAALADYLEKWPKGAHAMEARLALAALVDTASQRRFQKILDHIRYAPLFTIGFVLAGFVAGLGAKWVLTRYGGGDGYMSVWVGGGLQHLRLLVIQ
jgi:hypothetical protein